jgi:hypothetical protein
MATTLEELRAAIQHIGACSGDRDAWRIGLTPQDLTAVSATAVDPGAAMTLLVKIRANHPALFDSRTGAPITPTSPQEQRGAAAVAMKKAEEQLAHQNSVAATLDLHVISAILNAHTVGTDGGERLGQLQRDIENAVRTRTDLHTPTGARDFQRYLIDKLREIGAIVETANLDDTSKAALAGAWTALYEAAGRAPSERSDRAPSEVADDPAAPARDSAAVMPAGAAPPAQPLRPYGVDPGTGMDLGAALGPDPLLDSLLAAEQPATGGVVPAQAPVPQTLPGSGSPMTPPPVGLPGLGGLLSPARTDGMTGDDTATGSEGLTGEPDPDPLSLDELLGEYPPDEEPSAGADDAAGTAPEAGDETNTVPDAGDETNTVRLPDGSSVCAPSRAIANVIRAVADGTPVVEAFARESITVPPPGSAVEHPVDPARVVTGDIGMFTDRQALAVGGDRALLNGQVQPVGTVNGPSFLGWLHPPAQGAMAPADRPEQPLRDDPPAPTRPAGVPETAR